MEKEKFLAAIYLIIKDKQGRILLQRRKGTKLWPNYLALPAGHVDKNENVYEAAIREAKEELDIKININDIKDTFVVNRINKTLMPYFDIYFEIKDYKGNIRINEPDKCSEIGWYDKKSLPNDMIEYEKIALENKDKGIKFSTIEVKEM